MRQLIVLSLLGVVSVGAQGCKTYAGGAPANAQAVSDPAGGFALLYNDVQQVSCKQHVFGTDSCDTKVAPRLVHIGIDGSPKNGGGDELIDRYDLEFGDVGSNHLLALDGERFLASHAGTAYLVDATGHAAVTNFAVQNAFDWASALFFDGTGLVGLRAIPDNSDTATVIELRHFTLAGLVVDDPPIELHRFAGLVGNGSFATSLTAGRSGDEILVVWHLRQEIYQGLRLALDGTPLDAEPFDLGNVDNADETAPRIAASNRGWMVTVHGTTGATFVIPRSGRAAQVSDPVHDTVLAMAGVGSMYFVLSLDDKSKLNVARVDADGVLIDTQELDDFSDELDNQNFETRPVDSFDQFGRLTPAVSAVGDGSSAIVAYPKSDHMSYRHLSADGTVDQYALPGGGCSVTGGAARGFYPALVLVLCALLLRRGVGRAPIRPASAA